MSPPAAATSGDAPQSSPRELYTIPASSGWFRWDAIHDTERQALPEFFGGAGGAGFGTATRNPRIYREYRDFIIGKYREDPTRRLTFTEVRRALAGDVTLLRKLFAFLDASGLINFSATTSSARPARQQQEAGVVVEAPVGLQVTPRPPASYFAEEKKGGGAESGFRLPPLTSYNDVFWPGRRLYVGSAVKTARMGSLKRWRLLVNQTTDGKMNQQVVKESSSQSTEVVDGMQIDVKEDSADKSADEHPTKRRRLFSSVDATTSLMEQLALLTTATSPDVLAAAADAATKVLGNENPQARKAFRRSEREYKNKAFSSNHVQKSDHKVGDQDTEMQGQTFTDKKQDKNVIATTAYQVRAAVATAIGVAAARAKMLADQEEREMELLMASIIETLLKKIQYKIKHFEELEAIMDQEYTAIQEIKGSLINDGLTSWGKHFRLEFPYREMKCLCSCS
ncbi:hypothetical protein PR202_ga31628 [Eleusine coracana subsp. coracana]|uniref:SWIRM domain-containing protein n=1 Tax=Eleusine coracana subsp. coracana TaxID=191504 RepID=A0AAV5DSV4_ELECO|nr:hypothetical protein PR202_ga31628 [Eleusine coracana subsp. coracana]